MENNSKKILIVDDAKNFAFALKEGLLRAGFSVVVTKDGTEGLIATEKEKPDLILLDIVMSDMDGITMAERLRKEGFSTPIIFLTNIMNPDHIRAALKANIEMNYIVKSEFSIGNVVERVKKKLNIE